MGFPSGRGLILLLALSACDEGSAPRYRTAEVVQRDLVATIESTGRLRARGRLDLFAPISGRVELVEVEAGDAVQAGQTLVRVASAAGAQAALRARAELAAAKGELRRAEVQVEQARRSASRVLRLFEAGQRSAEVRDAAEAELASAEAAAAIARAELESARARVQAAEQEGAAELVAPQAGVVLRVDVEPLQRVQVGGPPLLVLGSKLETLHLAASVGESDVPRVVPGTRVRFEVPAFPEAQFRGVVEDVSLIGTENQGVVAYAVDVEADNSDGRLRPGMSAAVWFEVDRRDGAIVVPEAALRYQPEAADPKAPDRGRVHLLEKDALRAVSVERGMSDGAWVSVKGDLRPGDLVVLGVENERRRGEGGLSLGGD